MNIRSLLDDPALDLSPTRLGGRASPVEPDSTRRKRRKLDNGQSEPEVKGFRYGYEGEVVPGKLNMEIASCDGGIFSESGLPSEYAAENVLKNDDSVYCTKGNCCNLVLKHQGSTVFSLKEIVIRAPSRGYTAPYVSPTSMLG
jgi:hypothetical protein